MGKIQGEKKNTEGKNDDLEMDKVQEQVRKSLKDTKKSKEQSGNRPQYHTGREKGQDTRIWSKINNRGLRVMQEKIYSYEYKEEGIG